MIRIETKSTKRKPIVSKNPMMLIQAAVSASGNSSLLIWDMSLDEFPPNATFGKRYYGINGPTVDLVDRANNTIPDGVFCECVKISGIASKTDPFDWALSYTIK